jgi:hypothetical protein
MDQKVLLETILNLKARNPHTKNSIGVNQLCFKGIPHSSAVRVVYLNKKEPQKIKGAPIADK